RHDHEDSRPEPAGALREKQRGHREPSRGAEPRGEDRASVSHPRAPRPSAAITASTGAITPPYHPTSESGPTRTWATSIGSEASTRKRASSTSRKTALAFLVTGRIIGEQRRRHERAHRACHGGDGASRRLRVRRGRHHRPARTGRAR